MAKRRTKSQKQNARHQAVFSLNDIDIKPSSKLNKVPQTVTTKPRLGDDTSMLDYHAIKKDLTKTIVLSIAIIAAQLYLYTIWK